MIFFTGGSLFPQEIDDLIDLIFFEDGSRMRAMEPDQMPGRGIPKRDPRSGRFSPRHFAVSDCA
jgi:hypothetical protein